MVLGCLLPVCIFVACAVQCVRAQFTVARSRPAPVSWAPTPRRPTTSAAASWSARTPTIVLTTEGHFCAYLDLVATGRADMGWRKSPRCRGLHDGCGGCVRCDGGDACPPRAAVRSARAQASPRSLGENAVNCSGRARSRESKLILLVQCANGSGGSAGTPKAHLRWVGGSPVTAKLLKLRGEAYSGKEIPYLLSGEAALARLQARSRGAPFHRLVLDRIV